MGITYLNTGLLLTIIGLTLRERLPRLALKKGSTPIIVDSCGLIDGRIIDILASHFIEGRIIIPEFVVQELQLLADGKDPYKRTRARFGLDVATSLQKECQATIYKPSSQTSTPIDDRLIALACKLNGNLYTTDYNLGKVAVLAGISVLNVHKLAQSLRITLIPGDTIPVKIIQKGTKHNQGVAYADDGTMIVVKNAEHLQGKNVTVTITDIRNTEAGKMAFGVSSEIN